MFKTISSFNEVELTNEPRLLVLCDIDGTILHFPDCDRFCRKLIKELFQDVSQDSPFYEKELENLKKSYVRIRAPTHTDYDGFVSMVKTINEINGKLMFLTARHSDCDSWTKRQLKQIGINPEDFVIHYTGAQLSKGEYIKRHIDLSGWKSIIFIDDYYTYIKSVKELHADIVCYKFETKQ